MTINIILKLKLYWTILISKIHLKTVLIIFIYVLLYKFRKSGRMTIEQ